MLCHVVCSLKHVSSNLPQSTPICIHNYTFRVSFFLLLICYDCLVTGVGSDLRVTLLSGTGEERSLAFINQNRKFHRILRMLKSFNCFWNILPSFRGSLLDLLLLLICVESKKNSSITSSDNTRGFQSKKKLNYMQL